MVLSEKMNKDQIERCVGKRPSFLLLKYKRGGDGVQNIRANKI